MIELSPEGRRAAILVPILRSERADSLQHTSGWEWSSGWVDV